ncbi:hypothetical protein BGX21_001768, partial [Mortierella sp. AD011]
NPALYQRLSPYMYSIEGHFDNATITIPLYYLMFLGLLHAITVTAQIAQMAYVTLDESTLYIKGGFLADGSSTDQFYLLNLRQDWETSRIEYKNAAL